MLELNDVLLDGEHSTLSMMAFEGKLTCIVASPDDDAWRASRWLLAMLGMERVVTGYISLDGEPLTPATLPQLRRLMAYAPSALDAAGEVTVYAPPSPLDIFSLKANRHLGITAEKLAAEAARTGFCGRQAELLAAAVLLERPVLLADRPPREAVDYLRLKADEGRTVVIATTDVYVAAVADVLVELQREHQSAY